MLSTRAFFSPTPAQDRGKHLPLYISELQFRYDASLTRTFFANGDRARTRLCRPVITLGLLAAFASDSWASKTKTDRRSQTQPKSDFGIAPACEIPSGGSPAEGDLALSWGN
jgi:hypothetical protein